jgi:hypothetical protein
MKTRKDAKPRTPSSHAVDRFGFDNSDLEIGVRRRKEGFRVVIMRLFESLRSSVSRYVCFSQVRGSRTGIVDGVRQGYLVLGKQQIV